MCSAYSVRLLLCISTSNTVAPPPVPAAAWSVPHSARPVAGAPAAAADRACPGQLGASASADAALLVQAAQQLPPASTSTTLHAADRALSPPPPPQEALRAKAFYVGDNVTETKRQVRRGSWMDKEMQQHAAWQASSPSAAGGSMCCHAWLVHQTAQVDRHDRQAAGMRLHLHLCEHRCTAPRPRLQVARMAVDTKAPGQAPPDLPSLLLDGRICYIGMAVRAGACGRSPASSYAGRGSSLRRFRSVALLLLKRLQ